MLVSLENGGYKSSLHRWTKTRNQNRLRSNLHQGGTRLGPCDLHFVQLVVGFSLRVVFLSLIEPNPHPHYTTPLPARAEAQRPVRITDRAASGPGRARPAPADGFGAFVTRNRDLRKSRDLYNKIRTLAKFWKMRFRVTKPILNGL
jgi:hypothetical protein